jgi:polysaccharide biosynthesis protein PslG
MSRQETHLGHRSGRAAHLAGFLALAAIAIALTAPAAQGAIPRSFWGIGSQTALDDAALDRMGQGQVGTLRHAIFWSITDPSPAAGDEDWSSVDPIVAGAARNGVEILPFFFGTPAWVAQGLDGRNCQPVKCGTFAPKKKAALEAWKTYLGAAVDRYGPNGTFWTDNPTLPKLPFRTYQIWNEMNSTTFYKPKASPKQYAKLLSASAEAIRAKDPAAEIVLGGMAQLAGSRKAVEASEYLKDFYKVAGVEDDFDGVAIHPYGASVDKISSQVELFRKVMKQAGDSGASLWVTEIGAGSATGGNPLNRGKQGQAQLLTKAFKYFRKSRNKHNIESLIWFSWMDSKVSICEWCKTSGLFKKDLRPKPAWNAFTKFTGGS